MTLQQNDELGEVNDKRMDENLEVFGSWEEYQAFKADPNGGTKSPVETVPPVVEVKPTGDEQKPDESLIDANPPTAPTGDEGGDDKLADINRQIKVLQALKSERGRWDVTIAELKDLKERLAASEAERDAQAAEFEQRSGASDEDALLQSILSEEERELVDPATIKVTARLARAIAAKDSAKIRQELEDMKASRIQESATAMQDRIQAMWSEHVDPVIPPQVYAKFQENPKWVEWCAKSYAGQKNGALFNGACASLDSNSTVDLLKRFMDYAGIEIPTGTRPPRRPNTSSRESVSPTDKGGKKTFYADDVERIESLANRGRSVGMTPSQFEKWSEEVDDAREDSRVIDRATHQPVW